MTKFQDFITIILQLLGDFLIHYQKLIEVRNYRNNKSLHKKRVRLWKF